MPWSAEDEQQRLEYLRQSYENAVYQAFKHGKGVLPAGKNKSAWYGFYTAGILSWITYFLTRSLAESEVLRIAIVCVAFAAGFLVGGFFHDSQFVVDESWESPKVDLRR